MGRCPGVRVLVVDDDPTVRELLHAELTNAGHDVELAVDGSAGLELLRSSRPDAVLLDVMMPGLSGWEVLRELRSDSSFDGLTVVLLSARDRADDVRHGYELGASLVLSKPYDSEQLLSLLSALQDRTQQQ